jgi:hypothetical protein
MSKSLRRRNIKRGRLAVAQYSRMRLPSNWGTVTGRFSSKTSNLTYADLKTTVDFLEFIKPPQVTPIEITEIQERILKEMCELTALPLGYRSLYGVPYTVRPFEAKDTEPPVKLGRDCAT